MHVGYPEKSQVTDVGHLFQFLKKTAIGSVTAKLERRLWNLLPNAPNDFGEQVDTFLRSKRPGECHCELGAFGGGTKFIAVNCARDAKEIGDTKSNEKGE